MGTDLPTAGLVGRMSQAVSPATSHTLDPTQLHGKQKNASAMVNLLLLKVRTNTASPVSIEAIIPTVNVVWNATQTALAKSSMDMLLPTVDSLEGSQRPSLLRQWIVWI